MDGDDGGGLGVVGVDEVDAALGGKAGDELAVVVDVEKSKLRIDRRQLSKYTDFPLNKYVQQVLMHLDE